jgi:hypothetical protein
VRFAFQIQNWQDSGEIFIRKPTVNEVVMSKVVMSELRLLIKSTKELSKRFTQLEVKKKAGNSMKKLITLLLTVALLIANTAQAALFGPSNYEECMVDGKVGRTNAELYELRKYCRSKFTQKIEENKIEESLSKTFRNGNGNIRCIIMAETLEFNINKTTVLYRGRTTNVILNDKDKIIFKLKKIVKFKNNMLADGLFTVYKSGRIYQELYITNTNDLNSYATGECIEI